MIIIVIGIPMTLIYFVKGIENVLKDTKDVGQSSRDALEEKEEGCDCPNFLTRPNTNWYLPNWNQCLNQSKINYSHLLESSICTSLRKTSIWRKKRIHFLQVHCLSRFFMTMTSAKNHNRTTLHKMDKSLEAKATNFWYVSTLNNLSFYTKTDATQAERVP